MDNKIIKRIAIEGLIISAMLVVAYTIVNIGPYMDILGRAVLKFVDIAAYKILYGLRKIPYFVYIALVLYIIWRGEKWKMRGEHDKKII
jgi:hypothetical protein